MMGNDGALELVTGRRLFIKAKNNRLGHRFGNQLLTGRNPVHH
jgi:hypothetical protein